MPLKVTHSCKHINKLRKYSHAISICRIITVQEAENLLDLRTGLIASTVLFTHAPFLDKTVQALFAVDLRVSGVTEKVFKVLSAAGLRLSLESGWNNVDHVDPQRMELWVAAVIKVTG